MASAPHRRSPAAPRIKANNSPSIPRKPQARQQLDRRHAPNIHTSKAPHVRSSSSLCGRERSLDKRHRLAAFSRGRSIPRYAPLAGGTAESTDRARSRASTTFNGHARIPVRDRTGAGRTDRASSATRAPQALPLAFFSSHQDAGEWSCLGAYACVGVAAAGISACAGATARWRASHGRVVLPV